MMWNPLAEVHRSCQGAADRWDEATRQYSFAVPSPEAVAAIAEHSPQGVVEIGAGLGYWAQVLSDAGIDVIAYDVAPPPSPQNQWYAGREPFHPVEQGDAAAAGGHPERTLLIVWPTRNETWASEALAHHHQAGGTTVAVVGEPPGGVTGDDVFHAMLGNLPECVACRYGLTTSACTCAVPVLWSSVETVEIPRWEGMDDALTISVRASDRRSRRRAFRRRPS